MAEHDAHNVFEKTIRDLKKFGLDDIKEKRVLDLGCGQRYGFALQCAANDAKVTALDLDYVKPDLLLLAFYRTIKQNGAKRAIKSIVRRMLWDRGYYRTLTAYAVKPLLSYRSRIDFIVSNPTSGNYPLPSSSFDLIASIAVVEHVANVQDFAAEITRLLVSGGYFYSIIHNFYSLSGGHNLEWAYPDESPSSKVPPWDHLRENRFPAWTYLNRYKPEEYKFAFGKYLSILSFDGVDIHHDANSVEGERFLTKDIVDELKPYPKDLLLTRAWRLICRKE
jgi:SAM-dependent methyltransferase